MKRKIPAIFMVLAAMLFSASIANAGQITATHTVVSQQQTANGSDVTLNITMNNQGSISLSNITLTLMEPMGLDGPDSNVLSLGSLTAGTSVSFSWSISILDPEMQPLPLMIEASGTDVNGNAVHFPLLSEVQ